MLTRSWIFLSVMAVACHPSIAQTHQGQGTAVGGLTGAVIGGIIGHQNDEVPEGALIGGAVGAIAGNFLGAQRDQQVAVQRYYQHQNWHLQQQIQQQQLAAPRGVSTADVVAMCRSGLSDSVIIGHIQSNGVQRPLEVSDVISLHQQGVNETVIQAMQSTAVRGSTTYVTPPGSPRQVIVHEHYGVGRPYPPPVYYRSYHHHPRYRYW